MARLRKKCGRPGQLLWQVNVKRVCNRGCLGLNHPFPAREHVASTKALRFHSLDELLTFMANVLIEVPNADPL